MIASTFDHACEARGFARTNRHGDAVAANGGGVNPRNAERDGGIVQEQARLEIIGSVEDEGKSAEEFESIIGRQVSDDPFHSHARVDRAQVALGGNRFWNGVTRVRFLEKRLPLQV